MQTLRQISFGLLDIAWHGKDPSSIKNVKEFETLSFSATQLYPDVKENCMSTSFSHIFQGGYSAGYYSYKWAEVLDADAFKYLKITGFLTRKLLQNLKIPYCLKAELVIHWNYTLNLKDRNQIQRLF